MNLWFRFHGRVAPKVENLVLHHSEITILYAESSVEKFVFLFKR